jgi:glycosyltransferase involved in cell wall biosynthesis
MRICVINSGVVHAVARTMAFARYFDEVHYVDIGGGGGLDILKKHKIIYHYLDPSTIPCPFVPHLLKLLKSILPDGIVCHYASGNKFIASVLYGRCPVAVIAMGSDVFYDEGDTHLSPLRALLMRMAFRQAAYISAKSELMAARLDKYGVKSPVRINYWGLNLSRVERKDKVTSRIKLGLNVEYPVILSPRAVEPLYNIHLIVKAFKQVRVAVPKACLVILGRANNEYKSTIVSLVHNEQLEQNAIFDCEVSQDKLFDYYAAADVVISMARTDGFSNTILEVLAHERPMVIGDIPHVRELLTDGVHAVLCKIAVEDIARALVDVLKNPPKYGQMVAHGRQLVENVGDLGVNGKTFADDFVKVIAEYKKRKRLGVDRILLIILFLCEYVWLRISIKQRNSNLQTDLIRR